MTTKDKQDHTVTMDNKRKQIMDTGFFGDLFASQAPINFVCKDA